MVRTRKLKKRTGKILKRDGGVPCIRSWGKGGAGIGGKCLGMESENPEEGRDRVKGKQKNSP